MTTRLRRSGLVSLCLWCCGAGLLLAQAPSADSGGWVTARRTIPGGAPGASVIDLEQQMPREVRPQQPFDYRLRVSNFSDGAVLDVVVVQRLPPGTAVLGSSPQGEVRDGVATWRLGTLGVRESRLIQVRAVTPQTGALTFCSDTSYRAPLCVTVASTQPALTLDLGIAPEATLCDAIPVQVTVRNTGTAACRDVRLQVAFPEGLAQRDGSRQVAYALGALGVGASRQATLALTASHTGVYAVRALASAAEGLRAEAQAETRVVAPRLVVTQTGTTSQYAGRDVVYSFAVGNTGDTKARQVVVEDILPAGVQVVGVQPPTLYTSASERLIWRLDALPPGGKVDFTVTVRSPVAGSLENQVTARAECADDAGALHAAAVRGIAAILLEVVDVDDPIEIGGENTYVITATNQGTADCTGLVITSILEDTVEYVRAEGPTAATRNGAQVVFAPLPRLAPKEVAVWKVIAAARTAGDVRFRVLLTADQLTRPVEETESTRLY